jgi:NAD(P)-dependent dehydrogenase (short-subunit alcohol dehydrogenase family)
MGTRDPQGAQQKTVAPHDRPKLVAKAKTPMGPYRGVGRPISTFVMERLIDLAAAHLGIDPVDLRLRNLVRDDEFPYRVASGTVWDGAAFVDCLTRAREAVYGIIHCCHAVIPHVSDRKGGRIVNVVGDSARVREAALAITAASRGGVLALTKFLAKELGPRGITINVIALGLVDTSRTDKAWLQANLEKIVRLYPLRRIGRTLPRWRLFSLRTPQHGSRVK